MKRVITLVFLLVFVVGVCAAQAQPIPLAYKFTKGELDKYRMHMTMNMTMPNLPVAGNMPPIGMSMEMVAQQRTLEVLPDGSARVKATYSMPKVTLNGSAGKKPSIPNQTVSVVLTMTPEGRVTGTEGMEKMLAMSGLANFDMSRFSNLMGQYAFLPSEPVEVGDCWTQTVPMPFNSGDMTVDSTLESYGEQVWSLAAARVSQKFSTSMDLGQFMESIVGSMAMGQKERAMISQMSGGIDISGTMTFLFSPAIGKVLKGSGRMWASVTIGMPAEAVKQGVPRELRMDMTMKMSLTRFS
jgi:hypothetical protein